MRTHAGSCALPCGGSFSRGQVDTEDDAPQRQSPWIEPYLKPPPQLLTSKGHVIVCGASPQAERASAGLHSNWLLQLQVFAFGRRRSQLGLGRLAGVPSLKALNRKALNFRFFLQVTLIPHPDSTMQTQ